MSATCDNMDKILPAGELARALAPGFSWELVTGTWLATRVVELHLQPSRNWADTMQGEVPVNHVVSVDQLAWTKARR